jgi:hypothetical protein
VSTIERKIASPLYDGHIVYYDRLTAIQKNNKTITLDKPIYCGMKILKILKSNPPRSPLRRCVRSYPTAEKREDPKTKGCIRES